MDMMELIRPEMLTLIPVLYLIGVALKKAEIFENKYIPLGLGLLGALLGAAWLLVFRDAEYNAKPADGSGAGDSLRWVQRLCKPDLQTAE